MEILKRIKQALEDENWLVRLEAVKAFEGRNIPLKWIKQAWEDEDYDEGRNIPLEWIK